MAITAALAGRVGMQRHRAQPAMEAILTMLPRSVRASPRQRRRRLHRCRAGRRGPHHPRPTSADRAGAAAPGDAGAVDQHVDRPAVAFDSLRRRPRRPSRRRHRPHKRSPPSSAATPVPWPDRGPRQRPIAVAGEFARAGGTNAAGPAGDDAMRFAEPLIARAPWRRSRRCSYHSTAKSSRPLRRPMAKNRITMPSTMP